jgi:V-type H+-transporting ATPase proteolipid subunit
MKNVIPIVMAGGKFKFMKRIHSLPFLSSFSDVLRYILLLLCSVIGIYGLIVGVIIGQSVTKPSNERENSYSTYTGMAHLCAGLCTGLSGLAAGLCIGIVGDYGVRAVGYRASSVTLFPSQTEREGYANIPDSEGNDMGGPEISGSDDQNKLFVGMLIMLIFSEALAL